MIVSWVTIRAGRLGVAIEMAVEVGSNYAVASLRQLNVPLADRNSAVDVPLSLVWLRLLLRVIII